MTKEIENKFIEKGSDLEHDRWARWQAYLHSKLIIHESGLIELPQELYKRWERQIVTPYSELSEEEKESDRKETRNYLPLVYDFIKDVSDDNLKNK